MVLHVDIREILVLAWNNPLYTGGLVLLFTPPIFRVIIFFYPLLISTALCAVAHVSVGHQIEASREREIAGWNAKIVDGDGLIARLGSAKGLRNNDAGEDTWLKLVHDFEPSGATLNNEIERSNWVNNDEGLKKHQLRVDDGHLVLLDDQELLDRQIEAFREYERTFSVKTRAEGTVGGAKATPSNGSASPGIGSSPFTRTISVPEQRDNYCGVPTASRGGTSSGVSSPLSTKAAFVPEKRDSNCDVSMLKIPHMVLYNLRTGGTGRARKGSSGTRTEALSSCSLGAPAAVTDSQEKLFVAEGLPYGSIESFSRNVNVNASSLGIQRGTEPSLPVPVPRPTRSNVFETGTTATSPAAEMQKASSFAKLKNLNETMSMKNVTWPNYRVEGDLSGFTKTFGGMDKDSPKKNVFAQKRPANISSSVASHANRSEESHRAPTEKVSMKRFFAPQGSIIDSRKVASPSKPVEERSLRRARTHNSALRSANAVIYNASSTSSVVSSTRKSYDSVHR